MVVVGLVYWYYWCDLLGGGGMGLEVWLPFALSALGSRFFLFLDLYSNSHQFLPILFCLFRDISENAFSFFLADILGALDHQ